MSTSDDLKGKFSSILGKKEREGSKVRKVRSENLIYQYQGHEKLQKKKEDEKKR